MRSTILRILTVAALLTGAVPSAGEPSPPPGALELCVVDSATGEPVPYPNLVRPRTGERTVGNEKGVLTLDRLVPGLLWLRIEHIAYRDSDELSIRIFPSETARHRVELEREDHELDAVEVRAAQEVSVREAVRGTLRVEAEEAAPLPNPSDDVFQIVRALPGVSSSDLGGEFRIRGGSADETLVRIDGLELPELFHGSEFGGVSGVIPLQMVRSVDVYLGGFPAEYGGRLSGVIDIDLHQRGESGFHGRLGADAISSRAFGEIHQDERSFLVSVREGYLGRVLGAVQDKAVIEPNYRDLFLRTVLHPRAGHSLSFNYLRSEDHGFYEDLANHHFVDSDQEQHHFWTTGRFTPLEEFTVSGTLYRSRSRQDLSSADASRDDHLTDRAGGRLDASLLASGGHVLKMGAQLDREWGTYRVASDEAIQVSMDGTSQVVSGFLETGSFNQVAIAAYLQDEWKPWSRAALNVGGRVTHHSDRESIEFNPRLSAAVELPAQTFLRAAWGLYNQAPGIEIEGDVSVRIRSGRSERAEHRLAGLQKRVGRSDIGLELYDKRFHQLNGIVTRSHGGQIEPILITHGRALGLEARWSRSTEASHWWFSYTLSRSKWANDDWIFVRKFDRLHAFSLAGAHRLGESWDLGMAYSFHSGLPYTEQTWRRASDTRQWTLDEGIPNRSRLPAYHRLDLRVKRHFRFRAWELAVYLEALNLTNRDNVVWYAWTFRNEGGERRPARVPRTGMPGVPSLGLEARF